MQGQDIDIFRNRHILGQEIETESQRYAETGHRQMQGQDTDTCRDRDIDTCFFKYFLLLIYCERSFESC